MTASTKGDEARRRIKASQAQERRVALAMGGKVRPGSGSQIRKKGDVAAGTGGRSLSTLGEMKRTDRKSISFNVATLEKIRREALIEGRMALLGFQLGGRNYMLLEEADALSAIEAMERERTRGDSRR